MPPPIRIEPAALPDDLRALTGFLEALQEHERASVPELKPGAEIAGPYAEMLQGWVTARNGVILMARQDGETVGFVSAWIDHEHDPLIGEETRPHAYISDIYVAKGRRRQGVGRALLQAVEEEMRARGCRRLRIGAKADNRAAIETYQSGGFQPYEVILTKRIG